MRKTLIAVAIIFAFATCTRINFLHSISDSGRENVLRKDIVGKWSESGEEGTALITIDSSFSQDSGFVYKIRIFENNTSKELKFGDISHFKGELFEIQGKLFLILSTDYEHKQFGEVGRYNIATMIPTHYVIRVFSITNDLLEFGILDGDEFMKLVKNKKIAIKHEIIETNRDGDPADVIVFEKSNELKKKLIELEKFPDVYERGAFRKIK